MHLMQGKFARMVATSHADTELVIARANRSIHIKIEGGNRDSINGSVASDRKSMAGVGLSSSVDSEAE